MRTLILLLALISLSGCGLTRETQRVVDLARRTTFVEPRFYDYVRSDKLAQREARLLAEQAWSQVAPTLASASPDYENGFTEGFADYLYRGGEGEPPLIPPRGYWNLRFLNHFGKASTNDWYAGFRHGAQSCKSTGMREMWLVPSSLLLGGDGKSSLTAPPEIWSNGQAVSLPSAVPALDSGAKDTQLREPAPPLPDSGSIVSEEEKVETGNPVAPSLSAENEVEPIEELGPVRNEPIETVDDEDPFGNDPLSTDALIPESDPAPKTDVDIFELPNDVFESSDSFTPESDDSEEFDFSFQGKRSVPSRKEPLAIRSVKPASKMPSPVVLTSGEFDDDMPPPPESASLILSTDRAPRPSVSKQRDTTELPRGRPRMNSTRSRQQSRPQAQQVIEPANSLPMRVGESRRIPQTQVPRRSSPIRMAIAAEPNAKRAKKPTKPSFDDSLLLDLPPLGLTTQSPRSERTTEESAPVSKPNPVVVWLDGNVSDNSEPIPEQEVEGLTIESDEWEPFANEPATEVVNYEAPQYRDVMDEQTMQRSTEWNPQRGSELPLRVGAEPNARLAPIQAQSGLAPIVLSPRTGNPAQVRLRTSASTEQKSLPRIYLQQPSATQSIRPSTKSNLTNESTNDWRFRN